ncbi:endonuclease/exonuclease/phosphatase family protein [Streptomyces sp. NPDC050636]|uniref:endonuclease/exonuclease/phosphatase family protein n=1 Tax=Streptomyces sp. NPDC050636 TaxID=3154510 RepID=UPI0034133531
MNRRVILALGATLALSAAVSVATVSTAEADDETLTVMSLNTWHGGSQVPDGVNTTVQEIDASGAEVVALQETDKAVTKQLAEKLGWKHYTQSGLDVDIISSQPIEKVDSLSDLAVAAKIKGIWVYSVHLGYTKYGPYNACFDNDSYETIYADEAERKEQAEEIVKWAGSSPAIIAGDLNTPSHKDWTEKTKGKHCNSVVEWPATKSFANGGYWDSYREVNPDEAASSGDTWSPKYATNSDYGDRPEPQDRIDFILYKGGSLDATSSKVYGGDKENWPSDHRAVITQFKL